MSILCLSWYFTSFRNSTKQLPTTGSISSVWQRKSSDHKKSKRASLMCLCEKCELPCGNLLLKSDLDLKEVAARHDLLFLPPKSSISSKTTQSPGSTLLELFLIVLQEGVVLTLHSEKNRSQVLLRYNVGKKSDQRELCWKPLNRTCLQPKEKSMKLQSIQFIQRGKVSRIMKLIHDKSVLEDRCFSLMSEEETLHFEAESQLERDALYEGCNLLLAYSHAFHECSF
mmetsp:Transcript_9295/g.12133  ORF Transcript_9295/g.12133 Transcript_9295/m.12133 type:complete len:227 (+) Transcript_9295:161-841(+)